MSEGHARLGPSNHRWPHCPGSVREEALYEDVAGAAAIDGTGSHLLLELCLLNGVRAEEYEGQIIGVGDHESPNGWHVHRDRIDRVQMCLDYVSRRVEMLREQFPGCTVDVEPEGRSNPGTLVGRDDWWGTVDITITVRTEAGFAVFIEIVDYKDGRGWVHAGPDNTQLTSYAIGKAYVPRSSSLMVRRTIVQPKTNPVVRSDEDASTTHIAEQLQRLAKAAEATDDPEAPLAPGKHCQWCKANPKRGGHCGAAAEKSVKEVRSMTGVIATDNPSDVLGMFALDAAEIPADKLAAILDVEDQISAGFAKLHAEVERRLLAGEKVPGFAMGHGNKSNVWADEEEATKKLKGARIKLDDYAPRKVISPAQLKKLNIPDKTKERLWGELVVTKAGAEKVIRVAYGEETSAEDMFKDVPSTEELPAGTVSVFGEENVTQTQTEDEVVSFL